MVTVTKEMIQQVECPKCGAKKGKSCGHRKDKSKSHHSRMAVAQVYFNDPITGLKEGLKLAVRSANIEIAKHDTDLDYEVIEDYFDERSEAERN